MMVEQRMTETTAVSWAAAELVGRSWGRAVEPTVWCSGGTVGGATQRQHSGGLWGLGGDQAAYRLLAHEDVDWQAVLTPHGNTAGADVYPMVLCVRGTARNWTIPLNGHRRTGAPSVCQHRLYVHPTLTVTPDGVLGYWTLGCGPVTGHLWRRKRHWPIEAKDRMRWLKASNAAPNWPRVCPTPAGSTSPTGECDIHEFMVRVRRQPQIDWLIRSHPQPLPWPRVTIGGTDWRWRWSWARCASSSPAGRASRAGRWC